MFKKTVGLVALIVPLFFLSACESFTADRYIPASTNQAALKGLKTGKKVNVTSFAVESPEAMNVSCRLAGPIQVAGSGRHEEYIQKAFIDELEAAALYSPSASTSYSAVIKELHVATVSPASWTINGDFYKNDAFLKSVSTNFPFKTSYSAYGACNNAAENFPYAVEEFLGTFIKSPEFKKSLR